MTDAEQTTTDLEWCKRDPIGFLGECLRRTGARVTFDRRRNVTHPCWLCDATSEPRQLIEVGRYTRGGMTGDAIERPMCASCMALTAPASDVAGSVDRMNDRIDGKRRLAELGIAAPGPHLIVSPAVEHPTTIDSLIDWARWHPCNRGGVGNGKRHNHSLCEAGQTIIDALSVDLPCGVESPSATDDGRVMLPDVSGEWTVEDVRGIAAAMLRAAETAEAARVRQR